MPFDEPVCMSNRGMELNLLSYAQFSWQNSRAQKLKRHILILLLAAFSVLASAEVPVDQPFCACMN